MIDLKTLFPKASQSFLQANSELENSSVTHDRGEKQTQASVNLASPRGVSMNATERSYALLLEALKRNQEIENWKFESVKLRISTRCWYCPDFLVERLGLKPLLVEVKGPFIREDSRVKFLAAKELHTWADFEMHQRDRNGWQRIL